MLVMAELLRRSERLLMERYQANPLPRRPESLSRTAANLGEPNKALPATRLYRFSQRKQAVLRFPFDFAVPFDNNQAERDLRMIKVQQKISGCFRSEQGIIMFCRIRSYLSTLRKQGGELLSALEQALAGYPVLPTFA